MREPSKSSKDNGASSWALGFSLGRTSVQSCSKSIYSSTPGGVLPGMIVLLWILNFVISWFNAWGCGKTWNETKHVGGWPHFLNWMGAVMAASGFTWCYMVILGVAGATIPFEQDNGTVAPLLSPDSLAAFASLGYLVIIGPILGSGLAITVHSWGVFWRRKSLGNGAVAGYNTFAQIYNMYGAVQHVPSAFKEVSEFFGKDSEDGKGKGKIVLILVALAVLGGILTTWAIIRRTARSTAATRVIEANASE